MLRDTYNFSFPDVWIGFHEHIWSAVMSELRGDIRESALSSEQVNNRQQFVL